jgi:hypothetical protein
MFAVFAALKRACFCQAVGMIIPLKALQVYSSVVIFGDTILV